MPTSSITENITIYNPMSLVEYAKAMEAHTKEAARPRTNKEKSGLCHYADQMDG